MFHLQQHLILLSNQIYVDYQVLDSQDESIIVIEAIGVDSTATVSELDLNADDDGDVEISPASPNVDNNIFTQFYSIFAKDRDLDVEMDLYGGMEVMVW